MAPFGTGEWAEPAGDVAPQAAAADEPPRWYCEICGRTAFRLRDLAHLPAELIAGREPAICGLCPCGYLHG